ncbi:MAG: putative toxin-antitoxin system toxin component, PIN family, partial [Thermomicrobiales bacterium]
VVLVRSVINPIGWCGIVVLERRNRFQPVVSPAIVTEYLTVLQRPVIVRKYGRPTPEVLRSVLDLVGSGIMVRPTEVPLVCRDPNDDKFLAAAVTGNAEYIISEDRDLLDLGRYEGIVILSARAFLGILDQEES